MIQLLHPRIRIVLVLVGAFIISGILIKYYSVEEENAPVFEMQIAKDDLANTVANTTSSFLSLVKSVQFPSFESTQLTPTSIPTDVPTAIEQEWDVVPTQTPKDPLPTKYIVQTVKISSPTPYIPKKILTLSPPPTKIPQPTKVPAPTKIPKPTATPAPPPITSDVRPGTSIEEILREVSKRACIPYALLMATRTEESGAWMNNMSASVTKFYNTYGWWKAAGKGEICYALGYYTQSGLIPADSGGGSCNSGVQPGAYDQKIMGLMQMSEDEQNATRKYTTPSLPKNIDRRVLFDNALIYAYATKNRLGTTPKSCDDWPEDAVKAVAEKHFGNCAYPGGNYCTEIWNLYKSFR